MEGNARTAFLFRDLSGLRATTTLPPRLRFGRVTEGLPTIDPEHEPTAPQSAYWPLTKNREFLVFANSQLGRESNNSDLAEFTVLQVYTGSRSAFLARRLKSLTN